jgi:hypothetical protein
MSLNKKECAECGQLFLSSRSNHRFCKDHCRIRAHRSKNREVPEVKKAKLSIFDFYKQQIAQLSDNEILRAVAMLLQETPEARKNRKQSMLYTLLNKDAPHV